MPKPAKITVTAPARLHMGFIDLNGLSGRQFGSIGMAITGIQTRLTISPAPECQIQGQSAQQAESCLQHFCAAMSVSDKLKIDIESAIPEHVGLGSGTQMALAIGAALNSYYGLGMTVREIAVIMRRGLRSGIGIGVFERGGLVVDAGRGENTRIPPVISDLSVPNDWRFILVFDERGKGLFGNKEVDAFETLPRFSLPEAERMAYLIIMQALPALAEADLSRFGEVITELQLVVGRHFSSAQGGMYASQAVAGAMRWLESQGAVAIGQTSWGPTGFCAVANQEQAEKLIEAARKQFADNDCLSFMVVSADNQTGKDRIIVTQ